MEDRMKYTIRCECGNRHTWEIVPMPVCINDRPVDSSPPADYGNPMSPPASRAEVLGRLVADGDLPNEKATQAYYPPRPCRECGYDNPESTWAGCVCEQPASTIVRCPDCGYRAGGLECDAICNEDMPATTADISELDPFSIGGRTKITMGCECEECEERRASTADLHMADRHEGGLPASVTAERAENRAEAWSEEEWDGAVGRSKNRDRIARAADRALGQGGVPLPAGEPAGVPAEVKFCPHCRAAIDFSDTETPHWAMGLWWHAGCWE